MKLFFVTARSIFFFAPLFICATVGNLSGVGSWTAVSQVNRQALAAGGNGTDANRFNGFVHLYDGITLGDSSTTCTFDAVQPVRGPITLNGGTIWLDQDLRFTGTTSIETGGSIRSAFQGKSVAFDPSINEIDIADLQLDDSLTSKDSESTNFAVNSVAWSRDDNYVAVGINNDAGGDELLMYSFNGSLLTPLASGGNRSGTGFLSIDFHPAADVIAFGGQIELGDESNIVFYVANYGALGITPFVDYQTASDDVTAVSWRPVGNWLAVGGVDGALSGNEVAAYPITLGTPPSIGSAHNYALEASADVNLNAISWSSDGGYLAVGSGGGTSGLRILSFNTTTGFASVSTGESGKSVTAVHWYSNTHVAVGLSDGSLKVYPVTTGILGTPISLSPSLSLQVNSAHWNSDGTKLLVGINTDASGTELKVYDFDGSSLSLAVDLEVGNDTNSARWSSQSDNYIAFGDESPGLKVYEFVAGEALDTVILDNVNLVLQSDLTLNGTFELRGTCTIDGNGHTITLASGSGLVASRNSELTLSNVDVSGLEYNSLAAWNNSTMNLSNAELTMSGNWTCTNGTWNVLDNRVNVHGDGYTYEYSSGSPFSITTNGKFTMNRGTTFKYNSASAANLVNNGTLRLAGCTFTLDTDNSRTLTIDSGTLEIDDTVLCNGGVDGTHYLTFGDSLTIYLLNAGMLDVTSGFVKYG
jgi:hypothetical protein